MNRRLSELNRHLHRRLGISMLLLAGFLGVLIGFAVFASRDPRPAELVTAVVSWVFFALAGVVGWRVSRNEIHDGAWRRIGVGAALIAVGFLVIATASALTDT